MHDARILITGASSGIGAALARRLADRNRVLLTGRSEERLSRTAADLSAPGVVTCAGDLLDPAFRAALVETAVRQFGGLDVVVNCAGVGATGYFDADGPHHLDALLRLNLIAPVELVRIALPHLRRGNAPMIVNVASVVGRRGVPGYSDYCATKFALCGWSEAVRAELAPLGIHVLLVCPGPTATSANENFLEDRLGIAGKPGPQMSADECARHIADAMDARRSELVIGGQARFLVALNRWFPRLADRMLALKTR
ncbi:MAG: SDR family NAD(P)-dependent oxidoreductase [Gammaproteobacteria bacterium]